jgi:hypothetical protein
MAAEEGYRTGRSVKSALVPRARAVPGKNQFYDRLRPAFVHQHMRLISRIVNELAVLHRGVRFANPTTSGCGVVASSGLHLGSRETAKESSSSIEDVAGSGRPLKILVTGDSRLDLLDWTHLENILVREKYRSAQAGRRMWPSII